MFNNQKVVVTMTSWSKRIGNCVKVIQSILDNTVKPDIVFLNLSLEEFPNRLKDLPRDLVELSLKNPKVKIGWDYDLNALFQNEILISAENDELVDRKFIERQLSSIEGRQTLDMTMISVFYDAGIKPLRKIATKKAVSHWMEQKNLPKEMMFVELGFNGVFTFSREDFPNEINYIRIDGDDSNKYLFQKEHLWNIAAKRAKYEKLMFVDSDISPLNDADWFKEVYLSLDKCLFTQGFRQIQYLDKDDKNIEPIQRMSYNHSYVDKGKFIGVPGGVYCISKSTLQKIGYFNYLPLGGGDDLFWSEILGIDRRPFILLEARTYVKDVLAILQSETGKSLFGKVYVDIVHFYHGDRKGRSYNHRHYVLMTQYPWKDSIITDDENGLLSWIDVQNRFVNVIKHLPEMNDDIEKVHKFISGIIDYKGFFRDFTKVYNDKNKFSDKHRADIIKLIEELIKKHSFSISCRQVCQPNKIDAVLSFTTYTKRILNDSIYMFLDSIVNQKCPNVNYRIVCTLFKDDYQNIPERMLRYFLENDIEVLLCDNDFKSHKKYLYAMQKYPNCPVITVDDDAIYEQDMVKSLYEDYLVNKGMIIGRRIRKIEFDKYGHALSYNQWKFVQKESPSIDLFATTGGGTLFPPDFCKIIDETTIDEIEKTKTLYCDDFFLHYLSQKYGIMTKCVNYTNMRTKFFRGYMKKSLDMAYDSEALWEKNIKDNDAFVYLFDKK